MTKSPAKLTQSFSRVCKIEPESYPGPISGRYADLFANYAKSAFLSAVSVLNRGLFKKKKGVVVKKKVACRMLEMVSEKQMDELLKLTTPFRDLRDKDQHRENANYPEVWSIQFEPSRPTIGHLVKGGFNNDLSPIYELLKALEPTIGWLAFVKSDVEASEKKRG